MTRSALLTKAPGIATITNEGAAGKANQDAYLHLRVGPGQAEAWEAQPGQSLYIVGVADGVTGQAAGDYASAIAVKTISKVLRQQNSGSPNAQRLNDAIHAANQTILQATVQNPDQRGMSTTIVVAIVDQWQLYLAHLGDSRAYLIRNKVAHQLSLDHTWVQEALDAGRLDEADAQKHPNRHTLAKHLGVPYGLQIDSNLFFPGVNLTRGQRQPLPTLPLEAGDAILLCSDGVTDKISDSEIAQIVSTHKGSPQRAVNQLVKQALARKEGDNITAVLMVMPGGSMDAFLSPFLANEKMRPLLYLLLPLLLILAVWWVLPQYGANSTEVALQQATPIQQAVLPATATPVVEPPTLAPTTPSAESSPATATTAPPTATAQSTASATATSTIAATATTIATDMATTRVAATTGLNSNNAVTATSALQEGTTPTIVTGIATTTVTSGVNTTPTVRPTATKVVLATQTATATPLPSPSPTAGAQRTAVTPVAPVVSNECAGCTVTLDGPADLLLNGRPTFRWTPSFELGTQYLFELVFWEEGQSAMQNGRSPNGAGVATSAAIDLDRTATALGLREGVTYKWGVLLVDAKNPSKRIRQLSPEQKFQLQLSSSSNDSGGGNAPESTPFDE